MSRRRLRPFVARRVAPTEVDDVLQDVFVRMQRGLPALRDEERFTSWLFQIARNVRRRSRADACAPSACRTAPDDDLAAEPTTMIATLAHALAGVRLDVRRAAAIAVSRGGDAGRARGSHRCAKPRRLLGVSISGDEVARAARPRTAARAVRSLLRDRARCERQSHRIRTAAAAVRAVQVSGVELRRISANELARARIRDALPCFRACHAPVCLI